VGDLITHWVNSGGTAAVFVLMVVNGCGIPIPSEVIMPLAGVLAATGHLNVVAVVIAGAAGNLVGGLVAYSLSRRFGRALLLGPGRRIGISASHLDLADRWFARYGLATVFFGRLLPVVCSYVPFPAGLAKVHPVPFAVLTLLGTLIWCSVLTAIGYGVGANYTRISGGIGKAAIALAVLVVLALAVWFVRGRRAAARSTVSEELSS
jgi:membrane protein DedA with SNARE-associated domain